VCSLILVDDLGSDFKKDEYYLTNLLKYDCNENRGLSRVVSQCLIFGVDLKEINCF
jgi:hypothetical protein